MNLPTSQFRYPHSESLEMQGPIPECTGGQVKPREFYGKSNTAGPTWPIIDTIVVSITITV